MRSPVDRRIETETRIVATSSVTAETMSEVEEETGAEGHGRSMSL